MSEHKHVAFLKVRLDILLVKCSLFLIVDQDHDDICFFSCFSRCIYLEALLLSFFPGFASFVKTDDYITSGLFKVQCMCMSLASVSNNRNCLTI